MSNNGWVDLDDVGSGPVGAGIAEMQRRGTIPPEWPADQEPAAEAISWNLPPERIREIAAEFAALPAEEREARLGDLRTQAVMLAPDENVGGPEVATFQFADLSAIARGTQEPPPQLVKSLVVAEQVNWFAGHPEHGKTTIVMWAAIQVMEAGGHVIWLDWEKGKRPTVARLLAVGATPGLIESHFHYVWSPRMEATPDGFEPIAAALERWPGALVVFDSVSKALSAAGLSEDSNTEATQWTTTLVMPVRECGGTSVAIDHVIKSATRSVPYARGAGSKLADTEVMWYVDRTQRFNREQAGEIVLVKHKDSEGVLPERLTFEVGDGRGNLPVQLSDASNDTEGPADGKQKLARKVRGGVLRTLQTHRDRELSIRQVVSLTSGRDSIIQEQLRELAADPEEPVAARPEGQSVLYRYDEGAATALES